MGDDHGPRRAVGGGAIAGHRGARARACGPAAPRPSAAARSSSTCCRPARMRPTTSGSASPPGACAWTGSRRQPASSSGQRSATSRAGLALPLALGELRQPGRGADGGGCGASRGDGRRRRARPAERGVPEGARGAPAAAAGAGLAAGPPAARRPARPGAVAEVGQRRIGLALEAAFRDPGGLAVADQNQRGVRRRLAGSLRADHARAARPTRRARRRAGGADPRPRGTGSSRARTIRASARGCVRARCIALMLTSAVPRRGADGAHRARPVLVARDQHRWR